MTLTACPHEAEIRRLIQLGAWPHACAPELRVHAKSCRRCSELVLVTTAFIEARAMSTSAAQLPSAGMLQWRAQLRRRAAAIERIQRPFLGAQIFGSAALLAIAAAFVITQASRGWDWAQALGGWFLALPHAGPFHLQALWSSTSMVMLKPEGILMYLAPVLLLLVVIGGMVAFLAAEKH